METTPLKIITPEKVFYAHAVQMIVIDGPTGKEGFLPGHAHVLKLLAKGGKVRIQEAGKEGTEASGQAGGAERICQVDGGHLAVSETFQIYTPDARWISGDPREAAEAGK